MGKANVPPEGEIVYTSTTEIIAQSPLNAPPFVYGSYVIAGREAPGIGIVYNVETTSVDPGRKPVALGLSDEELVRMQPQLTSLLRTQAHALLIGTLTPAGFLYGLPGAPPRLHAGVRACTVDEIRRIGQDLGFLRLIFTSGKSSTEELLLSASYHVLDAYRTESPEILAQESVRLGKALSDLYRDDYDSLRRLMGRLETWLAHATL
jgi:hypothetical protein